MDLLAPVACLAGLAGPVLVSCLAGLVPVTCRRGRPCLAHCDARDRSPNECHRRDNGSCIRG